MTASSRPVILRGVQAVQSSLTCKSYAAAPATQPIQSGPAVYGSHFEVYKGKAAVQFKPIGPSFGEVEGRMQLQRKGVLLMELANSTGTRSYDWGNKIIFALSVTGA
jgi:Whirly transcription factor